MPSIFPSTQFLSWGWRLYQSLMAFCLYPPGTPPFPEEVWRFSKGPCSCPEHSFLVLLQHFQEDHTQVLCQSFGVKIVDQNKKINEWQTDVSGVNMLTQGDALEAARVFCLGLDQQLAQAMLCCPLAESLCWHQEHGKINNYTHISYYSLCIFFSYHLPFYASLDYKLWKDKNFFLILLTSVSLAHNTVRCNKLWKALLFSFFKTHFPLDKHKIPLIWYTLHEGITKKWVKIYTSYGFLDGRLSCHCPPLSTSLSPLPYLIYTMYFP